MDTLPFIEWTAVAFNIAYVVLAWWEKKACWIFGGIGSLLSVYYFQHEDIRLYSEAGLYAFYVAVAIYGWIVWSRPDQTDISEISFARHVQLLFGGCVGALVISYLTSNYTDAARPLADSFTTVFGVIATFMTIKKILSSWMYWIIIDFFSIFLYISRGSMMFAMQMVIFLLLAWIGWREWRLRYLQESEEKGELKGLH